MSVEAIEELTAEIDEAPIPLPRIELNAEQLQRIVEGALLAAGKPLTIEDIANLFDENERPAVDAINAALANIAEQCDGRGFELREIASGFRFQVIQDVAPWIARLWEEKPQRYSRALLETLALIAYRQPITRGDIEDIRGVAVASNIIKTLLERDWARVVGHKDVPGRPALYATTRKFLDYFNLKNLDDLPTLAEIRDLDSLNAELALEGIDTVNVAEQNDNEVVAAEIAEINHIAGVASVTDPTDASATTISATDNASATDDAAADGEHVEVSLAATTDDSGLTEIAAEAEPTITSAESTIETGTTTDSESTDFAEGGDRS